MGLFKETNIELFSFNKKASTALESEGAPNHPLSPQPPPNTHCGSQYVAAEPGRARRQRCYYIMKHAAQAQGRGGRGGGIRKRRQKVKLCGVVCAVGRGRGGGGGTVSVAVVTGEVVLVVSARVNHVVCVGEFSPSQKTPF